MMVTLTVKTNFPEVQRKLDALRSDIRDKALVRAVNRTVEQARTDMSREIRSEFVLSAEQVRSQLRIVSARFVRGQAVIEARLVGGRRNGRSLNLIRFVEKTVTLAEGKRRKKAGTAGQLFVKIKRKGGRKSLGPKAFIGNKGRTVFQRVGKERLPIKALSTIDVAQMFNTKRINAAVVRKMREKFPAIVAHEIKFYTQKFGAA
jgi:hypothetical protein